MLVDEFDAPITNAMFCISDEDELKGIVKLRDNILGNLIKLEDGKVMSNLHCSPVLLI